MQQSLSCGMVKMANPEHVAVVKKGAAAIEEWRRRNRKVKMNLVGADLSECDLRDANLVDANLSQANLEKSYLSHTDFAITNLSKANLSRAIIFDANFSATNLSNVNLYRAKLEYANLKYSELSNANFSRANLEGAIFRSPIVDGKVNFKNIVMKGTSFIDCFMFDYENLETVKHRGPSFIDIDTLLNSYVGNEEIFIEELAPFFADAGVPKSVLDALPEIVAGIAYCTCFVCYGEPDKEFAEQLVKDLRAEEIGCWIYSMDATPGKKIWREITQKRREADKMIVLCSAKSLIRDAVKKEIEEQLDEEPEKMIPISLDNLWKEKGFKVMRGERDLKGDLIDCTYADFSDPVKYAKSFRRLLKALKKPKK
jgi:hypothetical protein